MEEAVEMLGPLAVMEALGLMVWLAIGWATGMTDGEAEVGAREGDEGLAV